MIELQRKLLGDKVRNDAFHAALKKVIKKGESTVLDLGSGTGFLSFLASRLGAKHTTLIEFGDIVDTSEKLARRNKIKNLTFIHAHSTDVPTSEKYDVVVSETLGNYALEENIIESMEDAKRFLKKGGVMIPGKIAQFVCPVVSDRLWKDIDVWETGFDIDFTEAKQIANNNMYVKTVKSSDLLPGGEEKWDTVDFSKPVKSVRSADLTWTLKKPQTVYGLAVWWEAELVPGVTLSTSPSAKTTHWEQIFLPLLEPIDCKANDEFSLKLVSDTRYEIKVNLSWKVTHKRGGKVIDIQEMDMRQGYLA